MTDEEELNDLGLEEYNRRVQESNERFIKEYKHVEINEEDFEPVE